MLQRPGNEFYVVMRRTVLQATWAHPSVAMPRVAPADSTGLALPVPASGQRMLLSLTVEPIESLRNGATHRSRVAIFKH